MSTAEAPAFADNIKTLGESIVKLTVLEAKALGDYLEVVHGIKPAAAAVAVIGPVAGAAGAAPAEAAPPQTEFDVVLEVIDRAIAQRATFVKPAAAYKRPTGAATPGSAS